MKILQNQKSFPVLIILVLTIAFMFLNPRVLGRQESLKEFIEKTKSERKINYQSYWQLREFYSRGNFQFKRDGFSDSDIKIISKETGADIKKDEIDIAFLKFNSNKTNSIDILIKKPEIESAINLNSFEMKELIYKDNKTLIFKDNDGSTKIIFIGTIDQMKTVNGFFDYTNRDKVLLENKYWLHIGSFI